MPGTAQEIHFRYVVLFAHVFAEPLVASSSSAGLAPPLDEVPHTTSFHRVQRGGAERWLQFTVMVQLLGFWCMMVVNSISVQNKGLCGKRTLQMSS